MFRSSIARIIVMAMILGSLAAVPAMAAPRDVYMERPHWLDRGNPDDPISVGISTSVSSTAFPITANLAGPNLIPGVSGSRPRS